jgi:glutathione S-transferase
MKLHWSPRSPFVRKVMIVAHETGLVDQIDCVRSVAIRTQPNPDIIKDSPVGRIPVMVLEDGIVLSGSLIICQYLDSLHDGVKMIPSEGQARWRELELHGIADGLLDTLIFWRGEFMVPEEDRRQDIFDACAAKAEACLDWLESHTAEFSTYAYGIGQITTGVALEYLDFRFQQLHWRERHPELAAWHKQFAQRDSSKATEVVNDE